MFRITVGGETKIWYNFDYALRDILTRGLGREWIFEQKFEQGSGNE